MNNICIVEDEKLIALDLKVSLESEGFDVCSIVDNFEDALFCAEYFNPHFFLMDVNLAGEIDGIHIAEHILGLIETNIIFHSSDTPLQHADRLKNITYLDYLEKPADFLNILALLLEKQL